jgi:transcriptional regulator with XRE-family HTH domain
MHEVLAERLARTHHRRRLPEPTMRRYLRVRAGLTQDDIGAVLGVSRVAVTRWELGQRTPQGALLDRYIELLDAIA